MKPVFLYPLKLNTYRIIDGDTLRVLLDRGFKETKEVSIRFSGLNAPESRTRRKLEKQAGKLVTQVVEIWLNQHKEKLFYVTSEEKPKFAGRIIGRLWAVVSDEWPQQLGLFDNCINDFLLDLKVVKKYSGGKRSFSDEELQKIITNCNTFIEQQSQA